MREKKVLFKLTIVELLSVIFMFSIYLHAQNYNSQDTSKTNTSKSDTSSTKKDTLGYSNYNVQGNNIYASNQNIINSLNLQDSSMTDTSRSDTVYKKPDTLGFKNIKSPDYNYAYKGDIGENYYFQNDSSMIDTNKTDTTKTDTMSYNNNDSHYKLNKRFGSNDNHSILNPIKNSNFLVNPIKHLTQKLKLNVYLMDTQTPKVQEILREYEARTYQSNGDNNELNEAAMHAQENIAKILTARQRKEWENAKHEWWASVNKALNLSSISKNKNDLQ